MADGTISGKIAKELFEIVWTEGGDPREIVDARGLKQVTDTGEIERAVDAIIAANPDKVEQAKTKPAVVGWFVGQVMKSSGGKANPQTVNAFSPEARRVSSRACRILPVTDFRASACLVARSSRRAPSELVTGDSRDFALDSTRRMAEIHVCTKKIFTGVSRRLRRASARREHAKESVSTCVASVYVAIETRRKALFHADFCDCLFVDANIELDRLLVPDGTSLVVWGAQHGTRQLVNSSLSGNRVFFLVL